MRNHNIASRPGDMHAQEIELLRILQTILLLLTSTNLLHGETLAKVMLA